MANFLLAFQIDFRLYFVSMDGERHPGKACYEPPVSGRGTRREILKGLHQKSIRQGYASQITQRIWRGTRVVG